MRHTKRMKWVAALCCLILLLVPIGTTFAAQESVQEAGERSVRAAALGDSKEEVIYATLNASGGVESIYAVNIFELSQPASLTDYGLYKNVKNLTNTNAILLENDQVTFQADSGKYYYQGDLTHTDLPWLIAISYTLDGTAIQPADLGGKSGTLGIRICTQQNEAVDESFFNAYLLQISVPLPAERCKNIDAPGATAANAGQNKLLTYTVMPGTAADLTISADVTEFYMDSMELSAVPFSMEIAMPDLDEMIDGLTQLSDAISQLDSGVAAFKDGVLKMDDGAKELESGSKKLEQGLKLLDANSGQILDASSMIADAFDLIGKVFSPGLDLNFDSETLSEFWKSLTALRENNGQLKQVIEAFEAARKTLAEAIDAIPEASLSEQDLEALLAEFPGDARMQELVETYRAANRVKTVWASVSPAFDGVEQALVMMETSITQMGTIIDTILAGITQAIEDIDLSMITEFLDGISELSGSYRQFHDGLVAYMGGISELAGEYPLFDEGIAEFSGGVSELGAGAVTLYDGIAMLNAQTKTLPAQIDEQIEAFMAPYDQSDFKPVSFLSEQNEVQAVQFVMMTKGIAKQDTEPVFEFIEETQTFWTKLKNLFVSDA